MINTDNPYHLSWQHLEATKALPDRCGEIIEIDYTDFADKVFAAEPDFVKEITESVYQGTAYILKNAVSKEDCRRLIDFSHEYCQSRPSEFYKMLDGCPNYHRVVDAEITLKYSTRQIRHSHYLFRWNEDPAGVWPLLTPIWQTIKYFGGFARDAYESNLPHDGIVDRLQIVRYPSGGGGLKTHIDAKHNQKVIFGIMMSKRGEDYQKGGFYAINDRDELVDFEDRLDVGDIVIAYPTVQHGVSDVDPDIELDWTAKQGRWFVGFYSNDSDHVKNRVTSTHLG